MSDRFYKPIVLLCTWYGAGLSPVAPGTVGSLAALPFAALLQWVGGNGLLLLASALLFVIGCIASENYVKTTGKEDPSEVVIDEVAAQWLVLAFLPQTWLAYVLGFLLFRVFDVLKPWPVSLADRKVKGGFGIMLDDILAAMYALAMIALLDAVFDVKLTIG